MIRSFCTAKITTWYNTKLSRIAMAQERDSPSIIASVRHSRNPAVFTNRDGEMGTGGSVRWMGWKRWGGNENGHFTDCLMHHAQEKSIRLAPS